MLAVSTITAFLHWAKHNLALVFTNKCRLFRMPLVIRSLLLVSIHVLHMKLPPEICNKMPTYNIGTLSKFSHSQWIFLVRCEMHVWWTIVIPLSPVYTLWFAIYDSVIYDKSHRVHRCFSCCMRHISSRMRHFWNRALFYFISCRIWFWYI